MCVSEENSASSSTTLLSLLPTPREDNNNINTALSAIMYPRGMVGPIGHISQECDDQEDSSKRTDRNAQTEEEGANTTNNKPSPSYDPRFRALTPDEYDNPVYQRKEERDIVARLNFTSENDEGEDSDEDET